MIAYSLFLKIPYYKNVKSPYLDLGNHGHFIKRTMDIVQRISTTFYKFTKKKSNITINIFGLDKMVICIQKYAKIPIGP